MPNLLQSFWLQKNKWTIAVSTISVVTMIAGSLALPNSQTQNNTKNSPKISYNEKGQKVAAAGGEMNIVPGDSVTIEYAYANENAGNEQKDGTNEALLEIKIGAPFTIDASSLTDTFDSNGDGIIGDGINAPADNTRVVCPSLVNTTNNSINYRPYSATNPSACSGESTRGPVDFTGIGQKGVFRVRITLKADILTTARPMSEPARNYKVDDVLLTNRSGTILGIGTVVINEAASAKITTWIGSSATILKEAPTVNNFIISNFATNPITLANIGNGTCWEGPLQNVTPIRIGQPSTCVFPLSGGTNGGQGGYSIPADFSLRLDNAASSAPGSSCLVKPTAVGALTYNLECTQVPSNSATPGIQPITITASGATGSKGTVSLATPVNADTISSIVCAPNPQVVGTPVNCTVNLTGPSPFIPTDFKLKVGTSVGTNCSVTGLINSNSFTCVGIATSSNTIPANKTVETFPVFQSADNFAVNKGTTNLTPIINPVQNSNITSAACTPTTLYLNGAPVSTTCTAQLNSNSLNGTVSFTLANMTESCNAPVITGQNTATCIVTPTVASPASGTPVTAAVLGSTNGQPVSAGTLNILSIGRPVATTASPIVGTIGSPMPNIPLTNSNVPNGTQVTFTTEGCSTGILGTISNNTWTPSSATNIPDCALINSRTGVLSAPNFPSVNVPTNFSPKPTIGQPLATTASPITGKIGNTMPNIPLTNSNVPSPTTVVTFTPAGCTTPINGTVQNQTWVSVNGSTIPDCATIAPQTGTLSPN